MKRYLTDFGPTLLVPAAWAVTLAAHVTPLVTDRTLFVALCVMDGLLAAFFLATRGEMTGPVLGAWQRVLLVGLVATVAGTVDMAVDPGSNPLLAVTLGAWVVLPAVAYVQTGRAVERARYRRVHLAGATLSLAGGGVYALGGVVGTAATVTGLVAVGAGQTAGIVAAAVQNA